MSSCDVNTNYSTWLRLYDTGVDRFVPKTPVNICTTSLEKSIKNDQDVKTAIKFKHKLFAKSRASPKTPQLKIEYKAAAKSVKKLVNKATYTFERSVADRSKQNPKILYSYINSQKQSRDQVRMLTRNGADLVDGSDIANCLNDAFHGVFTVPRRDPMPHFPLRTEVTCNPSDSFITEQAVYSILIYLNIRKSTGVDKVHPHVLRECASSLAIPLSSILCQSYNTSSLPEHWLKANVTPIYKKGKRSNPLNYRPSNSSPSTSDHISNMPPRFGIRITSFILIKLNVSNFVLLDYSPT